MPIKAEDFEKVCKAIETTHKGLHSLCKEFGINYQFLREALDISDNYTRYTRAREAQLDYLEELYLTLVFEESRDSEVIGKVNIGSNHINRDRLKADALKFVLSKLRTHVWGDRIEVTTKEEPRVFKLD